MCQEQFKFIFVSYSVLTAACEAGCVFSIFAERETEYTDEEIAQVPTDYYDYYTHTKLKGQVPEKASKVSWGTVDLVSVPGFIFSRIKTSS